MPPYLQSRGIGFGTCYRRIQDIRTLGPHCLMMGKIIISASDPETYGWIPHTPTEYPTYRLGQRQCLDHENEW